MLVEKTAQQKQIEAEKRAAIVEETKARETREKMEAMVEEHGSEVRYDPGIWDTQRGAERDEKQAMRVQEQCEAKLVETKEEKTRARKEAKRLRRAERRKAAGQDVDENKATVAVEDAKAADKAARKGERDRREQERMEREYQKAEQILKERSPNPCYKYDEGPNQVAALVAMAVVTQEPEPEVLKVLDKPSNTMADWNLMFMEKCQKAKKMSEQQKRLMQALKLSDGADSLRERGGGC